MKTCPEKKTPGQCQGCGYLGEGPLWCNLVTCMGNMYMHSIHFMLTVCFTRYVNCSVRAHSTFPSTPTDQRQPVKLMEAAFSTRVRSVSSSDIAVTTASSGENCNQCVCVYALEVNVYCFLVYFLPSLCIDFGMQSTHNCLLLSSCILTTGTSASMLCHCSLALTPPNGWYASHAEVWRCGQFTPEASKPRWSLCHG